MRGFNYVGGNGGRGGDVILECSSAVWDFSGLQHHIVLNPRITDIFNHIAWSSGIKRSDF